MNAPIQQVLLDSDQDDDELDLTQYLDFLLDHRWLILGAAFVVTLLGAAYAFLATPIYESNLLIQVEDSAGSSKNILGDLSSVFDVKSEATAEIEILRSRFVVSRAVDNTRLYIDVQPRYFPLVGKWIASHNKDLSQPGLFGMGGYAWGAEKADVSIFNVPEELEDEPFVLTAEGNGRYQLTFDDPAIQIKGKTGELVKSHTESGDIALQVDRLDALPGAQFRLVRSPRLETVEKLQENLAISEKGKQSGIIGVSLQGADRERTTEVLNQIGAEYVRQNVERKAAEAEKSLQFLNRQLPELKQQLERSEDRYNQLRNSRGSVDFTEEAKAMLQESVLAQTTLAGLKQKREELLVRFQENNPVVVAVAHQIASVERQLQGIESKIKQLPLTQQDVLRRERDVKVNTELYTSLLDSAQQMRLLKASKVGNVRLLDHAVEERKPVKPKRLLVIVLSALIGFFVGVIAAFLKKTLFGGIDDPHAIEQALGLTVSAAIPYSSAQDKLYTQIQNKMKAVSVLANEAPSDSAIESMRSFRTSFQFSMLDAKNNIILITGPTPGVGKSFVSVNFASVLASTGKKVLLIDADLRKGYLNRYFGVERTNGLSEVVAGNLALEDALHKGVVENVDFIATGTLPPKPADLLAHGNFTSLLQSVSAQYDYVVVDTAPVLAVADASIVSTRVGTVFSVVRGGLTTLGEIEETVKRLNQAGSAVTGVVFNGLVMRSSRYGYGGRYGKYRYAQYEY